MTPKRLVVKARKGRAASTARISWTTTTAGTVKLTVRKAAGKPGKRTWRKAGTLTAPAAAGAGSLKFDGRLAGKALKPGTYRLEAVATDATGSRSALRTTSFKVVVR